MFRSPKRWISWHDVRSQWGLKDVEIVAFLRLGLKTYSSLDGTEIACPYKYHACRLLQQEKASLKDEILFYKKYLGEYVPPNSLTGIMSSDASKFVERENREKQLSVEIDRILRDDPELISWKHFMSPTEPVQMATLMWEMQTHLFRRDEFTGMIRATYIKAPDSLKSKRLTRNAMRGIACEIWSRHKISIGEMVRRPEILRIAGNFSERTCAKWIYGLAPCSSLSHPASLN